MNSLFLTQLILIGVQLLPLEESCLMQTPSMFPTYIHSPRSEYLLCALVKLLLTTRPPFLPFSALLSWGYRLLLIPVNPISAIPNSTSLVPNTMVFLHEKVPQILS